jgi:hypothetical protein
LRFAEIAKAYELMPDGFWALLSIVIAFYFGGRMQVKRQDMAVKGGALAVARDVLAIRQTRHELAESSQEAVGTVSDEPRGRPNRVIETWRQLQLSSP